uniref:Uncharacterized protein n=1 Tax=Schistocephalus solidus TaxID=70667 RepID=A0A0X3Q8P8_SCHSO
MLCKSAFNQCTQRLLVLRPQRCVAHGGRNRLRWSNCRIRVTHFAVHATFYGQVISRSTLPPSLFFYALSLQISRSCWRQREVTPLVATAHLFSYTSRTRSTSRLTVMSTSIRNITQDAVVMLEFCLFTFCTSGHLFPSTLSFHFWTCLFLTPPHFPLHSLFSFKR